MSHISGIPRKLFSLLATKSSRIRQIIDRFVARRNLEISYLVERANECLSDCHPNIPFEKLCPLDVTSRLTIADLAPFITLRCQATCAEEVRSSITSVLTELCVQKYLSFEWKPNLKEVKNGEVDLATLQRIWTDWMQGYDPSHWIRLPDDWCYRKQLVYLRDGGKCARCGRSVTLFSSHTHHIVKRGSGGNHSFTNLICLCIECHGLMPKHNLDDHSESPGNFLRQRLSEQLKLTSSKVDLNGEFDCSTQNEDQPVLESSWHSPMVSIPEGVKIRKGKVRLAELELVIENEYQTQIAGNYFVRADLPERPQIDAKKELELRRNKVAEAYSVVKKSSDSVHHPAQLFQLTGLGSEYREEDWLFFYELWKNDQPDCPDV